MDLGIKDLRVLVTAGAGGIGLEIARAFVREGARVHICDVDEAALAAAKKSDPQLTQSVCDVADRAQVAKLFDDALKALGGLDCLVNNAGIAGPTGKVEEINPEDWDRCLAIDITGQFNCVRLAVPHLKQSKNASIMNLSSQAGKHGFPLRSAYAAAKWGVIGFTKSIAIELGPLRHPRQRAAARPRRRRPHPPRDRGQGAAGRRLVQGEGGGAVPLRLHQGLRHAAAARRHGRLHGLAPRQDHLRPGHLGVRRYEYAGSDRVILGLVPRSMAASPNWYAKTSPICGTARP